MKNVLTRLSMIATLLVLIAGQTASALSLIQSNLFQQSINNFDATQCDTGTPTDPAPVAPGSGTPTGTAFPNLDPGAMGDAIQTFITKNQPSSPLKNLGSTIVASAKNANVNPFLVVGIADQETSLATADTPQVTQGHAPFNRRATSSQPHISIPTGIWYKWKSFKASVDYTDPDNRGADGGGDIAAYLENEYKSQLDSGDLTAFIAKYDPGGGATYVNNLTTWMKEMAQDAGGAGSTVDGPPAPADPSVDGATCCPSGTGTTSITGETTGGPTAADAKAVQQVVWNTLTSGDVDAMHTAAVMGNISIEGVWDPENSSENPSAPPRSTDPTVTGSGYGYGLIGWTPGQSLLDEMKVAGISGKPYTAETQSAVILAAIQGKANPPYTPDVGKAFLNTTTIEDATTAYQGNKNLGGPYLGFERPSDESGSLQDRINAAKGFLTEFGGTAPTDPASPASPGGSPATCCPTAGGGGGGTTLEGKTPGEQVFNYFVNQEHFTDTAAAAATGNLQQESGFSTTIDNGKGYVALAQWGGDRLTKLQSKPNWESLQTQLEYVSEELHSGYKTALHKMQTDTSIEDLTYDWVYYYEGAVDSTQPKGVQNYYDRLRFAKHWLQQADGGTVMDPSAAADPSGGGGGCADTTGSSGYSNPFHSTDGLVQSRIDEGVDYASTKPVPLYAIGNGVVKIATDASTFYTTSGGHADWITYQLSDGPAAGKYIYVSEACPPLVKAGQTVTSDTHLCDVLPDSIETGWALDDHSQAAAAINVYTEGYETAYGVNFNKLLVKLGAPGGHLDTGSDPDGTVLGTLPDSWPTW